MPLEFRDKGSSRTQFSVLSGHVIVASLYRAPLSVTAGQAVVWRWTFYMTAGPPGFRPHGRADSFDQAKAMIEAQWSHWLDAAQLRAARQ